MNRRERRFMESLQRKQGKTVAQPQQQQLGGIERIIEDLQSIHTQISKVTEFQRNLYNSLQLMRETLERKGVMDMSDLRATEEMYHAQVKVKEEKVKDILSSSMSDFEKIDFCMKELTEYKPGYEKYNINPIKDLNVPPPVVNEYLSLNNYRSGAYMKFAALLGIPESMYVKELCDSNFTTPGAAPA